MTLQNINRRDALKTIAAGTLAVPMVYRHHASAAPIETVYHASFGASGMAGSDIASLTESKNLKLVAVAEVDLNKVGEIKKRFPDVKIYQDWRELLDKEKSLNSVNISTPDHMHAPITMRAMQQGLHVYTQKPLTQTIYEARQLSKTASEKKLISQMGIQIHSHEVHRSVVATIQAGAIGKVKEVHSWSGKGWGDTANRPDRKDEIPKGFNWDSWLGVAQDRPFIGGGYYHPGNWRKRLDFGTGTFGDMGCHILDPVFGSLALTSPKSVHSYGPNTNEYNWTLDVKVKYVFPGTAFTTDTVELTWYNGALRPEANVTGLIGNAKLSDQGSIYIGTKGVMYSPYIAAPVLLGEASGGKVVKMDGRNHYLQFVEAVRGNDKTSAPFEYAGPLTESVLLGCLATRFSKKTLEWDAKNLMVTNEKLANQFVRKTYRKGWEVEGL
ncbi:Gfo/Idh/MocA family oxidoreductase [Telmatocola sphagniphila]|uniref:Gfo/Idh/MocA family oxidoreductase n=1 Tax=Telmatocola sphagniphila TaxID=1123043 RepID=A0A8E6B8T3_9BACT|nr:Gfo/Idh/MocA family oxidoreductase [Telmatocola sphagniphila]QVL33482.1 Gfo/Idh/MocA family oxidoreductase [Telmatocola sphagniphila]